jgi:hypothetical protein
MRRNFDVVLIPERQLFRDTIVYYAESLELVDLENNKHKRELFRLMRVFLMNWQAFSASFVVVKGLVGKLTQMGMRMVVYSGGQYYWMKLGPELLNYCYAPMIISDDEHPAEDPYCMLPTTPTDFSANLTIFDRLVTIEKLVDDYVSDWFSAISRFLFSRMLSWASNLMITLTFTRTWILFQCICSAWELSLEFKFGNSLEIASHSYQLLVREAITQSPQLSRVRPRRSEVD